MSSITTAWHWVCSRVHLHKNSDLCTNYPELCRLRPFCRARPKFGEEIFVDADRLLRIVLTHAKLCTNYHIWTEILVGALSLYPKVLTPAKLCTLACHARYQISIKLIGHVSHWIVRSDDHPNSNIDFQPGLWVSIKGFAALALCTTNVWMHLESKWFCAQDRLFFVFSRQMLKLTIIRWFCVQGVLLSVFSPCRLLRLETQAR